MAGIAYNKANISSVIIVFIPVHALITGDKARYNNRKILVTVILKHCMEEQYAFLSLSYFVKPTTKPPHARRNVAIISNISIHDRNTEYVPYCSFVRILVYAGIVIMEIPRCMILHIV